MAAHAAAHPAAQVAAAEGAAAEDAAAAALRASRGLAPTATVEYKDYSVLGGFAQTCAKPPKTL